MLIQITFFTLFGLIAASATPRNGNIVSEAHSFQRLDLEESSLEERRYSVNPHGMLKTPQILSSKARSGGMAKLASEPMISVDFVCAPPTWSKQPHEKTCNKVKNAFQGALQHVQDAFDLRRPIRVKFEFSSFCQSSGGDASLKTANNTQVKNAGNVRVGMMSSMPPECASTAGLLGYAAPAAYLIPETPDPVTKLKYSYPQALVKQLLADGPTNINFNSHDIYARFNADQEEGLWFKDEGEPIQPSQYDFQYIVLHEFMHGMGLVSNWNMAYEGLISTRGGTSGNQMLVPIFASGDYNQAVPSPQHTTIFDKYISTTAAFQHPTFLNAFAGSILSIVNALPQGSTLAAFYKSTILDKSSDNAARLAYAAATTARALQFTFPDGTAMLLHTEQGRFLSGTSIVHANYDEYTGTTEFLMRPYANNGTSLQSLGGGKPFGSLTLKVFETMGYTIKNGAANKRGRSGPDGNWIRQDAMSSDANNASALIALVFTIAAMMISLW